MNSQLFKDRVSELCSMVLGAGLQPATYHTCIQGYPRSEASANMHFVARLVWGHVRTRPQTLHMWQRWVSLPQDLHQVAGTAAGKNCTRLDDDESQCLVRLVPAESR